MAFNPITLDTIQQTFIGNIVPAQYILYANGLGQSFWAPAVTPSDISTFSTQVAVQYSSLSSYTNQLGISIVDLSTNAISTVQGQNVSSATTLTQNFNILSNQFNAFAITQTNNFQTLSNNLTVQVNDIYNSSLAITNSSISSFTAVMNSTNSAMLSTIYGISSISTFFVQISAVQSSLNASASSLSTAITRGDLAVTSTLQNLVSSQYISSLASSYAYTDASISTLSSVIATASTTNALSTSINLALLSSVSSLQTEIGANYSSLYIQQTAFEASTLSTQTWAVSTVFGIEARTSSLEGMSTQLSSYTIQQISSYVEPLFQAQDQKFSAYTSTLLYEISSVAASTFQTDALYSTISSINYASYSTLQDEVTDLSTTVQALSYELSVLTTSSILAGVYDTFLELEAYTVNLVNSTVSTVYVFLDGLYLSTTIANTSTADGFFGTFVSSVYASTVSTVTPVTLAYASSLISSLYSTGTVVLNSSFQSTIVGQSATASTLFGGQISTLNSTASALFTSSIQSVLSTPTAAALSTFSTLGFQAISTFNVQSVSSIGGYASLQTSSILGGSATFSTTIAGANSTVGGLSSLLSTYTTAFSTLFTSTNTAFITQLSTQGSQFNSSQTAYTAINISTATGTNNQVLAATTAAATSTLNVIQTSTLNTYNAFVDGLNAAASTIILSSLYTVQDITLTSTNFVGTMDLATYRNFNINVRAPLVSGSSNYRTTYTSNSIGTLDYRKGIITVDVSTIGSGYSNNDGRLNLDVYRWGLPTSVFGEIYPSISNADYTAMYEYTILNSIVYTNLLNVYPRLRIQALQIGAGQTYNVDVGGTPQTNFFWRGTPLQLAWSNYSAFPIGQVGAPPYMPDILVDVLYNNQLQSRNGPYPMTVSTATVNLPYLTGAVTNPAITTIRTYYVGKPMDAAEFNVNVLLPQFQEVRLRPAASKFASLQEIQGFTDGGTNTFLGLTNIGMYGTAAGSNLALNTSTIQFGRTNAVDGNAATICVGPSTTNNPDVNAYLQLIPNLQTTVTSISSLVVSNVAASCNQARGGVGNGALEMDSTLMTASVLIGATQYRSTIYLTTAATQRFVF